MLASNFHCVPLDLAWMQESLGGNAKTTLVVCCAGTQEHADETLQSLQFASRAMCVKNKPMVRSEFPKWWPPHQINIRVPPRPYQDLGRAGATQEQQMQQPGTRAGQYGNGWVAHWARCKVSASSNRICQRGVSGKARVLYFFLHPAKILVSVTACVCVCVCVLNQ